MNISYMGKDEEGPTANHPYQLCGVGCKYREEIKIYTKNPHIKQSRKHRAKVSKGPCIAQEVNTNANLHLILINQGCILFIFSLAFKVIVKEVNEGKGKNMG